MSFFEWLGIGKKIPSRYRVTTVPRGENKGSLYSLYMIDRFAPDWRFVTCTADQEIGQAWIANIKTFGQHEKIEVES